MAIEEPENEWNSDEMLDSMKAERVMMDESFEQQTKRLIQESGPIAAATIVDLAMRASNENTRLNAAKYVVDRLLDPENTESKQYWESMVDQVTEEVEEHANGARS